MFDDVDINLVRGLILILLIVAFLGIWAWAWSKNRKQVFHDASRLPLEEDAGQVPDKNSEIEGTKE